MAETVVCALYKFVTLADYARLRQPLLDYMLAHEVRGTLLLAREGINGTVAGTRGAIDGLLAHLQADERLNPLDTKESYTATPPFLRSRVKLKKEIVTMGVEDIDPRQSAGTYVKPADWNALISDPEVLLVDTRNDYEVQVGSFKDAVNPQTTSFREFPEYVKNTLDPQKHKKVAMFCTGGIRCEKSTAYLREQGFEEVYHLEGGILRYLEEVPQEQSLWQGECFVFDERVTVNHQLEKGNYDQCHACRMPITEADQQSPQFEHGVSCPHCFDKTSHEQKQRYAERQRQIQLARQRGEAHIGVQTQTYARQNRQSKLKRKQQHRQNATQSQRADV